MSGKNHERVVTTLCELYKNDTKGLVVLLTYLALEEERCKGRDSSGVWNMLVSLLDRKQELLAYTDDLIKQNSKDPDLEEKFVQMNLEMAKHMDSPNKCGPLDILKSKDTIIATIGLTFLWKHIPSTTQGEIISCLVQSAQHIPGGAVVSYVGQLVRTSGIATRLSKALPYVLSAAYLLYEIGTNIYRWRNGEITGKRCAANVTNSVGGLSAGMVGAGIGATIGSVGGPIGMGAGALIGGFIGSLTGESLTSLLTGAIFDLAKSEALDKAYDFLGVHHKATDEEVRDAYKKKLLICHPDKGGSQELFLKLQSYLGIIVTDRGWKPN